MNDRWLALVAFAALTALPVAAGAGELPAASQTAPQNSAASSPPPPHVSVTPPPTQPQLVNTLDLEAGGGNAFLNAGRGTWNQAYLQAQYASVSGFKAYATAENDVRFGLNDDAYGFGVYVPTKGPHGVLSLGYAYSPQHNVLPASAWAAGYDLRAGGGYGYQLGFQGRSYTDANAALWNAGADRYFGDQRLALLLTFTRLSNAPGTAVAETVQWAKYLPMDAIRVSLGAGREVENTGSDQIATYSGPSLDVDELHWLDSRTAIHANVGYYALSGAYDRFEVLLGLHVRL